jgi:hypothetical protein
LNPGEEFAVVAGTVGSEILEDASKRRGWHRYLKEVVAERNLYVVSFTNSDFGRVDLPCCLYNVRILKGEGWIDHVPFAPLSPRKDRGSLETPS